MNKTISETKSAKKPRATVPIEKLTTEQFLSAFASDIVNATDTRAVVTQYSKRMTHRENQLLLQNPTATAIAKEWLRCVTNPENASSTWIRINPVTEKRLLRVLQAVAAVLCVLAVLAMIFAYQRWQATRSDSNDPIIEHTIREV
jgi:hypothetical protein